MDKLNSPLIQQLDFIPDGLLDVSPQSLHTILATPTLLHLSGKRKEPLFISVLLHGNEPTGFFAVQALLKKYQQRELPRSLSLFFGNVTAASKGLRRLKDQPDYNRIWRGTDISSCPETIMADQIIDIMQQKNVFASIDIHNNTGLNPHYACINKVEPQFLQLATLFSRLVIYFKHPKGVQSSAFADLCPAVTLECGRPGQQYGVEHALEFIDSCLNLAEIPDHPVHHQDVDLVHTVAQVKVKANTTFSFEKTHSDLLLNSDLEKFNFTEVPAKTNIGLVNELNYLPLIAQDESGNEVTDRYFGMENNQLFFRQATIPSMLTLDERVIKQDCLCYLMERWSY